MKIVAAALEIFGLLVLAVSVAAISLIAGGIVLGLEAVLLGLALERR